MGLLNPHSVQRGRSQAARPVHSGGLHAEQQSSVQGHLTASGADWEACSPPFAICLLNLCPRLLRRHLELLLRERAELSPGPHTLHQAKVKDRSVAVSEQEGAVFGRETEAEVGPAVTHRRRPGAFPGLHARGGGWPPVQTRCTQSNHTHSFVVAAFPSSGHPEISRGPSLGLNPSSRTTFL